MSCLSEEDATKFITEFNAKNNEPSTPDWYMYAEDKKLTVTLDNKQIRRVKRAKNKRMWLSSLK